MASGQMFALILQYAVLSPGAQHCVAEERVGNFIMRNVCYDDSRKYRPVPGGVIGYFKQKSDCEAAVTSMDLNNDTAKAICLRVDQAK